MQHEEFEQARKLGADHVIDYTQVNFTKSEQHYDLILAANGYHSLSVYKRVLNPEGKYVMAGGFLTQIIQAIILGPWMSRTEGKKMGALTSRPTKKI